MAAVKEPIKALIDASIHFLASHLYLTLVALITVHYFVVKALNAPKRLKISEIYVYPIKSLRGTQVPEALATKNGFAYDRTFMLLKVTPEGYKNMAVAHYYEMTQFLTTIIPPGADDKNGGYVKVDFVSPKGPKVDPLKVPLQPNTEKLANLDITLHNSFTKAFKMPAEYNGWFSKCFGYEVVLAYLGENLRGVLFEDLKPSKGNIVLNTRKSEPYGITFADCAPYLVVSKTSLGDVSARLPDGQEMDITKFRPNIVLEGAIEPWEEDYWGKLEIKGAELDLPHNCVRCRSINVDYTTGEQAPGDAGEVLKKLQKDRRVDKGAKWSPVFGRYSYWNPKHTARVLKAGDEVLVTKFNSERTTWSWPGLS